jgi:hypothetical protein
MLADVPMVFVLIGITAYTVLSGADFGAGMWTLIPGGGRASAAATRDHTRHSIGPVWEANHVWLIFVLTVAWTCYPVAFGSIASTLAIPLLIAAIGIIFRGTTYALRSQFDRREGRGVALVEDLFALSSVLTPFALATVVGGIATGRVPVGNARGNIITSWLNPVSIMAGVLAVFFSGYLAAVYLAADARRGGLPVLERERGGGGAGGGRPAGGPVQCRGALARADLRGGAFSRDRQRGGGRCDAGLGLAVFLRAGSRVGGARGGGGHRGLGRGPGAAVPARADRPGGRGRAGHADRDHHRGRGRCSGAGAVAGAAVHAGAARAARYRRDG